MKNNTRNISLHVNKRQLRDIVSISTGNRPPKDIKSGQYAYINGGTSPSDYLSVYNSEPNAITTPTHGEGGIGFVAFQERKFWCGALCLKMYALSSDVNIKYIFYYLSNNKEEILSKKNYGGMPYINKTEFSKIQISLPHIKVQEEIVEILDSFTNLIDALNEELSLRQKQFEYYREKLLTFDNKVEHSTVIRKNENSSIDEIDMRVNNRVEELLAHYNPDGVNNVTLSSIGDFENIGVDKKKVEGEPLVTLLNYVDVYHNKTIKKGVPKMIVSSPVNKVDKCSVEKGDIFITPTSETVDDIGHSSLVLETLPQTVYSYHIMRYRLHDISMTTASYINQCFETRSVKEQILKKAQGLTRFGVSKNKFGEIEIPLPHIKVQEEIVEILDFFTNLIDALNEELSLRQKQYEYYREKLLTFD